MRNLILRRFEIEIPCYQDFYLFEFWESIKLINRIIENE